MRELPDFLRDVQLVDHHPRSGLLEPNAPALDAFSVDGGECDNGWNVMSFQAHGFVLILPRRASDVEVQLIQ